MVDYCTSSECDSSQSRGITTAPPPLKSVVIENNVEVRTRQKQSIGIEVDLGAMQRIKALTGKYIRNPAQGDLSGRFVVGGTGMKTILRDYWTVNSGFKIINADIFLSAVAETFACFVSLCSKTPKEVRRIMARRRILSH